MKDIRELFAKLEFLPPSPSLIPKLLPALADLNSNFDEIVNLIELDPALTAKLLQICNSAFFGSSNPVEDVRQAVTQTGYQSISLLAAMIEGSECFQAPEVPGVSAKSLWKHSVTTAFAAKAVGETMRLEGGLVFTAGLMHDLGKIILARAYGTEYGVLCLRAAQSTSPVYQAEMAAYGYTHAEVGALLLEKWKLPLPLVNGVRFHHHPKEASEAFRKIAGCVCVGNLVAHAQEKPIVLEHPDFQAALTLLHLTPAAVKPWQEELRKSHELIEVMTRK